MIKNLILKIKVSKKNHCARYSASRRENRKAGKAGRNGRREEERKGKRKEGEGVGQRELQALQNILLVRFFAVSFPAWAACR